MRRPQCLVISAKKKTAEMTRSNKTETRNSRTSFACPRPEERPPAARAGALAAAPVSSRERQRAPARARTAWRRTDRRGGRGGGGSVFFGGTAAGACRGSYGLEKIGSAAGLRGSRVAGPRRSPRAL